MTINIKNFLNEKTKLSKMGEFQSLKQIDGLEMASISADLYEDGRDDLALFYFKEGANYATLTTTNSIDSETISWNDKTNKKVVKALLVNTKNANKEVAAKVILELRIKINPASRPPHAIKVSASYPLLQGACPVIYHLRPSP